MSFTLTPEQRAACDAFEKTCRELCVGRMKSIDGGYIANSGIVTGGVQDGVKVYWPSGYETGLADRLEKSIQIMMDEHAEISSDEQLRRRIADIEAEAARLRQELECVA